MSSKFRIFISKRLKSAPGNPITIITWNKMNRLLACGYYNGTVNLYYVNPSSDQPGSLSLEPIQLIDYHNKPITALAWSDNSLFLTSGDSSGSVAFWNHSNKAWRQCLANTTVSSPVRSINWNKRSELVAISFANSTVVCVKSSGELLWSNGMRQPVDFVEWTPRGNLLCGASFGEIMILDQRGVEIGTIPIKCFTNAPKKPKLVAIEYNQKSQYGLIIVFQSGEIQLMRNEQDTQPIIIKCELELTTATWFKSGTNFVVAGVIPNKRNSVVFFTSEGDAIRELALSGTPINSMSLNPNDTVAALSDGSIFSLAQIVPSFIWAFTKNALLYAYNNPDSNNFTIVYYKYITDEKRTHTISNVIAVSGHSGTFAIASKGQLNDATIYVTDTIGVSIAKTVIPYVPTCISVYGKAIAICAQNKISLWRYKEKDGPQTINFKETISALHLSEKLVYLSVFKNIVTLDISSLAEVNRYSVGILAESISLSSDGTTLALIDDIGTLQFFSIEKQKIVGPASREVWNAIWSQDNPNQFAASERQKIFVYNNLEREELIQSLSHIAQFSNHEILCVDLIRLMADPINPGKRLFKSYSTKVTRDLTTQPTISVDKNEKSVSVHIDFEKQELKEEIVSLQKEINQLKEENKTYKNFLSSLNEKSNELTFFDFDEYKEESVIGKGATSNVKIVSKKELYAIKELILFDHKSMQRFLNECEILFKLRHPCIVHVYGFNYGDKTHKPSIIMSLEPKSLEAAIKDKELNNEEKNRIIVEFVLGMRYIHKHKFMHRDLKPMNILLSKNKHVRITDFGLAKEEDLSTSQSKGIGTLRFMAPELFEENNQNYNNKVDVYSFGIILIFIVTGNYPPFSLKNVIKGQIPKLPDNISKWVCELIISCLSLEPKNRPSFSEIFEIIKTNNFDLFNDSKNKKLTVQQIKMKEMIERRVLKIEAFEFQQK